MVHTRKSTALYPHPFSKAYWKDAFSEMKDIRMLVIAAMLTALRIALKPLAIPLGPQLSIQTAMLATALGAMIYGPVMAIPCAIISDTIGFVIYPTGEYFLPFVLTEIASTMIYALCLYRSKVSPTRVTLARFFICFLVNVVLQQVIFAWQYIYMGNPESAKSTVMGIMTSTRIIKNLFFFPIESVILTLFLKFLLPICQRARVTYCKGADMKIGWKQIVALVCLLAIGVGSAFSYFTTTSRSSYYSSEDRLAINKELSQLVQDKTEDWDDKTLVCIVDAEMRPFLSPNSTYTLSVYIVDEEAFAKGQEDNSKYTLDTLYGYSKSGPKKDKYGSLVKVADATVGKNGLTGEILAFDVETLTD